MRAPLHILVDHAGTKGLGDVVCEFNLYPALRRCFPDARLYSRNSRTLAWGHPDIDGFDQSSPLSAFDRVYHLESLTELVRDYHTALLEGRTVFEHFLWHQGFPESTEPPQLYVLPREMEALGLEDDGKGGLIVGYSTDSKDLDRRWGEERFHALLQYLEDTYDVSLIELGSGLNSGHSGLGLDLVGRTNVRQTMAVLSLCDLFIGNHGGLTHLAGGVGTPILSPWGASTPYAAYAYDPLSIALETAPACRHCNWTLERLESCLNGHFMFDRAPCTQAISVEQMMEAADHLIPTLLQEQTRLKEAKQVRRLRARIPETLDRFDRDEEVSPDTRQYLILGGVSGWGAHHSRDNFARLSRVVAFPNWSRPDAWQPLVADYVRHFQATDQTVLMLSAYPLTGPEVKEVLETYLYQVLKPAEAPRIAIILGALDMEDRCHLIDRAKGYVPLKSDYHVPQDTHPTATPHLEGPDPLCVLRRAIVRR